LVYVSVWFFWFQVCKTEPVGFLKILISLIIFFHGSVFSAIFFSFLGLIDFSVFFTHLYYKVTCEGKCTHIYVWTAMLQYHI
jgi:hypothetical protein